MRLPLYIVIALFSSSTLFGQTATLRGVVTDESGAIVPGATVAVTSNAGAANSTVSAGDGSYSIAVPPGDYTVQASAPDLKSGSIKAGIRPGVQVLNLQLKVTSVAQEVTVRDRAATVTPEPAKSIGSTGRICSSCSF